MVHVARVGEIRDVLIYIFFFGTSGRTKLLGGIVDKWDDQTKTDLK